MNRRVRSENGSKEGVCPHAKRVRFRMAEVVSKITGLCSNKDRMDKGKVRGIMKRVAEPKSWVGRAYDSRGGNI